MTHPLDAWTFGLILFCVLAEAGTQLNFKAASDASSAEQPILSLIRHPLLWAGIGLWAVEVIVWLRVLEHAPLAIAYPVMTLTYAVTPLAAAVVLGERMTRGQQIGAGLVSLGVLLVSLSDVKGAA